ncbi:MAG: hypothetical protein GC145_02460 [Caulobacter sp.]|nr:hypothetical protein [Caulobacter sp.]
MSGTAHKSHFAAAVRRRSLSVIQFGAWIGAFILAVLLVPWEAIGEKNGAPPLLLKGFAALHEGRFGVGWWIFAAFALTVAMMALYTLLRGLTGLADPRSSSIYRNLGAIGDPETAVRLFEAEAATPVFRQDKPRVVATANWLMVQDFVNMALVPMDDIVWVHGAEDQSGDVVGGIFRVAGVISARQQRLNALLKDMDLVVYRRSTKTSEKLTVNSAINPLLTLFLTSHPQVIVGHSKALEDQWNKSPDDFIANAARPETADAVAPSGNITGIFDVVEQAMDLGGNLAPKSD